MKWFFVNICRRDYIKQSWKHDISLITNRQRVHAHNCMQH
jgi:hypothetical protein